jgi:two-component system, NarL family, nitrate/nitrite response regulator NarL
MNDCVPQKIRLLIVDDHALFREGLARLLRAEAGLEVVALCASGKEAFRVISTSPDVDVLLLDLDLGKEKGTDLLDWLHSSHFEGKVLVVTASVGDTEVCDLIRRGVTGIFMKHGSPASLIQGIRGAVDGKAFFDEELLRRALKQVTDANVTGGQKLTERERQVLSFVCEGLTNKEIAARLKISETAVKSSLQQLFAKTGVRTRSQLVRVALEQYANEF